MKTMNTICAEYINFHVKTCERSYIGQTSWNLTQRYPKHIRYIKNNDPPSACAQHILRNLHKHETVIDTMTLLKHIHKIFDIFADHASQYIYLNINQLDALNFIMS